jgi:hypothetical protein
MDARVLEADALTGGWGEASAAAMHGADCAAELPARKHQRAQPLVRALGQVLRERVQLRRSRLPEQRKFPHQRLRVEASF